MNNVIKVENLVKNYVVRGKKIEALKGCSFQVKQGSSVGFVGLNGAGKSTTIKILTGIIQPDEGNVEILGKSPITERKKIMQHIGVLFGQRSNLIYDLPVKESFALLKRIYHIQSKNFNEQFELISEYIDVRSLLDIPVRQLSLGQRMRCEAMSVLLHKPEIVIWDEAFLGIDFKSKSMIQKLVKYMIENEKTTFFITSHDIKDIEKMCKDIIIINDGKIAKHDKIENLIKNSKFIKVRIRFLDEINLNSIEKLFKIENIDFDDNILNCWIDRTEFNHILSELSSLNKIESYLVSDSTLEEIIEQL